MGNGKKGFALAITMLVVGMTVGFVLLGIAYEGPIWVKAVVFVVYLSITAATIHFSKRFIDTMQ